MKKKKQNPASDSSTEGLLFRIASKDIPISEVKQRKKKPAKALPTVTSARFFLEKKNNQPFTVYIPDLFAGFIKSPYLKMFGASRTMGLSFWLKEYITSVDGLNSYWNLQEFPIIYRSFLKVAEEKEFTFIQPEKF